MIMPTISTDIQRISHQVRLSLKFESASLCAGVCGRPDLSEASRFKFLDEIVDSIARRSGRKEFLQLYL